IFDYVDGNPIGSTDLGTQPAGVTLQLQVDIAPPTGTETLVLVAEAQPGPLSDDAQCSFHVVAPTPCMTACDCNPGEACVAGSCSMSGGPRYCCTNPVCPVGFDCQFPGGNVSTCM